MKLIPFVHDTQGCGKRGAVTSRGAAVTALAVALTLWAAPTVRAQAFVSPFIGYDFGPDTGCLNVLICADRRDNVGVSAGWLFGSLGVEEEVAYAKDFFGTGPSFSSSVLTAMTNALIIRRRSRWQPYAVAGLGVMKTHAQFTQATFYTTDLKDFTWDAGGGVAYSFGRHWGVRGDVRYFRSFRDTPVSGFTISSPKLGFGRGSVGLVVRF